MTNTMTAQQIAAIRPVTLHICEPCSTVGHKEYFRCDHGAPRPLTAEEQNRYILGGVGAV